MGFIVDLEDKLGALVRKEEEFIVERVVDHVRLDFERSLLLEDLHVVELVGLEVVDVDLVSLGEVQPRGNVWELLAAVVVEEGSETVIFEVCLDSLLKRVLDMEVDVGHLGEVVLVVDQHHFHKGNDHLRRLVVEMLVELLSVALRDSKVSAKSYSFHSSSIILFSIKLSKLNFSGSNI